MDKLSSNYTDDLSDKMLHMSKYTTNKPKSPEKGKLRLTRNLKQAVVMGIFFDVSRMNKKDRDGLCHDFLQDLERCMKV